MNIAICDDDILFCQQLYKLISAYFNNYHIKDTNIEIYNNAEALSESNTMFDLTFLNVEMSGLDGILAGSKLIKKNPNMIFIIITSYPQQLDEALYFCVFRNLTKPLNKRRLYTNLKDALYIIYSDTKKIAIETKDSVVTVNSSKIIMLETLNHKVVVHTDDEVINSVYPLKTWLEKLEGLPFFQSHKSFIINFNHVVKFDKKSIHLTSDKTAYLTQRKYNEFKKEYMMYIDATI